MGSFQRNLSPNRSRAGGSFLDNKSLKDNSFIENYGGDEPIVETIDIEDV